MSAEGVPDTVRERWKSLAAADFLRIETGLINATYIATDPAGERVVVQRLHPVFDADVNRNIEAVTRHLSAAGLLTPKLIPCDDGNLCCIDDGRCWRVLSFVSGQSFNAVTSPAMARQAGHITARFHTAMTDFDYRYAGERSNVHDTRAHLEHLRRTLATCTGHRLYEAVKGLAVRILSAVRTYARIDDLPRRHAHGDLKISNILYDDDGHALCLIDLDTVTRMPWPLEMGDGLRSWCNPRTENQLRADLDLDILDAALAGYADARPHWLTSAETELLIAGLERICLELSARFLADALTENYFSWDRNNYDNAGDHNLARGHAMARLYQDVCRKRDAARELVRKHFPG